MASIPRDKNPERIRRFHAQMEHGTDGGEHDEEATRKALRARAIHALVGDEYIDQTTRDVLQKRALKALVSEILNGTK